MVGEAHALRIPQTTPLSDSPWFWAYLFGTAALIALFLGRASLSRSPGAAGTSVFGATVLGASGRGSQRPRSAVVGRADDHFRSVRLYAIMAILLAIAWGGLWYQRFRRRQLPPSAADAAKAKPRQGNPRGSV